MTRLAARQMRGVFDANDPASFAETVQTDDRRSLVRESQRVAAHRAARARVPDPVQFGSRMNRHANRSAARAFLASAFVCISLCWAALTLAEESSRQYDIDIGELPLSQALQAFSQQTGLQYGYLPTDDEEERLVVGPIKGRLTAERSSDEAPARRLHVRVDQSADDLDRVAAGECAAGWCEGGGCREGSAALGAVEGAAAEHGERRREERLGARAVCVRLDGARSRARESSTVSSIASISISQ